MSSRRSERARSSQQQQQPPPSHTSSTTSLSSSTKNTRTASITATRTASPRRGSTQRSESIDDPDSSKPAMPRRSRRGEEREPALRQPDNDEDPDDEAVEEEVTRCICGHAEYPGPPAWIREKFAGQEPLSDDLGNFFVQCDNCSVWSHAGCAGLLDEATLPDEYYCEQCKPEFHRVIRAPSGTKSTRYLPVLKDASSRSSSLSSNPDQPGRKDSTKSKQSEATKRRATMNSRGAYDEDEMLRRAIEESKEMGTLGKRLREEGDDLKQTVKRQRTGSISPSTISKHSQSPPVTTTEDGGSRAPSNGNRTGQKLRGAAARNNKEKEQRDKLKEQAAAERALAASKRNARSERRRGDDSPPPTPSTSPSKAAPTMAAATNARTNKADTPPAGKSNNTNHKKVGGRPPARRGRLGRNQYTRDLPMNGDQSDTPMRDTSHDRNQNGSPNGGGGVGSSSGAGAIAVQHETNGTSSGSTGGVVGKSSKAKTHPMRTSMNEMKRRVAAILEFVGRMQTERGAGAGAASTKASSGSSSGGGGGGNGDTGKGPGTPRNGEDGGLMPVASLVRAVEAGLKDARRNHGRDAGGVGEDTNGGGVAETAVTVPLEDERAFKQKDSVEMMETLTKELVGWQTVYGTYSR